MGPQLGLLRFYRVCHRLIRNAGVGDHTRGAGLKPPKGLGFRVLRVWGSAFWVFGFLEF